MKGGLKMQYKDYYQILGVSRYASQDEIKRAYRQLARKYHPDVSDEPEAEQRFKEIGEAYEVLKDSQKRATYDQFGNPWQARENFTPDWDFNFNFGDHSFNKGHHYFDFKDIFENLFGQETPRSYGSNSSNPFNTVKRDRQAKITLSLEEAYQGTTRALQLQSPGNTNNGQVLTQNRTINVKIPPGVIQGQKIRLTGQGYLDANGNSQGDLYLEIELLPHRLYRAEGRDIYLTLPITPWEAALGSLITVPTLAGKVELKIPADSQSGQTLRLKGRGFPGKPPGDQYVVLQIMIPKANTEAARALYRRMAQELDFNPRNHLMD